MICHSKIRLKGLLKNNELINEEIDMGETGSAERKKKEKERKKAVVHAPGSFLSHFQFITAVRRRGIAKEIPAW